jgi:hypothetical protein
MTLLIAILTRSVASQGGIRTAPDTSRPYHNWSRSDGHTRL